MKSDQTLWIADPDYHNGDFRILTDSLYYSGDYAVKLNAENPFSLGVLVENVNGGEVYEASLFRYGSNSLLKLAAETDWGFYAQADWGCESFGDWEQIFLRLKIPDSIQNGQVTFFAYQTGPGMNIADSLTVQKIAFSEKEKLPDCLFFPLLYKIQNDYHIRFFKPLAFENILDYAKNEYLNYFYHSFGTSYYQFAHTLETHLKKNGTTSISQNLKQYRIDVHFPSVGFEFDEDLMEKRPIAGYTKQMFFDIEDSIHLVIEKDNQNPYQLEVYRLFENYTLEKIYEDQFKSESAVKKAADFGKGFYAFLLRQDADSFKIPIIIQQDQAENKVAILSPYSTYHAYNAYGGQSFYRNATDKNDVNFVSVNRPLTSVHFDSVPLSHDLFLLHHIYNWFDTQYGASVYPDYYLEAHPEMLKHYNTIVLALHAEYFSPKMYRNLTELTNQANLISLGGNQIYWKIKWHDDFQTMEVRKCGNFFKNTFEPGGLWRNQLTSEAQLLGVAFTESGMGTYAPYEILDETHFLLAGIELPNNMIFGEKGIDGRGLSGIETDKIFAGSPAQIERIAKGTNNSSGGGEIVFYQRGNYATLSCGSISCGSGLGVDSVFTNMVKNFMQFVDNN